MKQAKIRKQATIKVSDICFGDPDQSQPLGISYTRFSELDQSGGDSVRRQVHGTVIWCERNGVHLDTTLSIRDLGVSGFKGKHRDDKHNLGKFLKAVREGRVPKGSYLIIENLDRLTREDERTALRLWLDILDAGIHIVQLNPETVFRHDKCDMIDIMRAIIELSRGHRESQRKSDMVAPAWAEKKNRVREGQAQKPTKRMGEGRKILTRRLPAWVEDCGGRLEPIPARAAVVKLIFQLAANGYGLAGIVKRLTDDQVPAFTAVVKYTRQETRTLDNPAGEPTYRPGRWVRSYVANILGDRRAVGEYQPRKRTGEDDGPPVPGYFPVVVSEEEWLAARAGADQRRPKPGRLGEHINVLAGLLKNARDGDTYYATTRKHGDKRHRVLMNLAAAEGRGRGYSFPLEPFEQALFSRLREIDPHSILNGDAGPDETFVLSSEQTRIEARIAEIEAELEAGGPVPELARVLRRRHEERADIVKRLAAARRKASFPLSEAWGATHSLLEAIDAAPDPRDVRLRLRAAVNRIIASVWLLVVPRGADRLCAVQIWFAGGERQRTYLIVHRPPKVNAASRKEGWWRVESFPGLVEPGDIDLRQRADAARVERWLADVPIDELKHLLAKFAAAKRA
jgi:DNA invertase Pin-like site-specific DNA recombinase